MEDCDARIAQFQLRRELLAPGGGNTWGEDYKAGSDSVERRQNVIRRRGCHIKPERLQYRLNQGDHCRVVVND